MTLAADLATVSTVYVRQRKELAELFALETRNKYAIETESGAPLGFAAEQSKGVGGFLGRQMLGHWRSFEIRIFDRHRNVALVAHHPFRFWLERLEIRTPDGRPLGSLQQRFSLVTKVFDLEDATGAVIASVSSPIWRPWTYEFQRHGVEVGAVRKKWGGLIREAFLDADSFAVEFTAPGLEGDTRLLLLGAALFIDILYFEGKVASPFSIADLLPG